MNARLHTADIETPFTRHAGVRVPLICGPMYPCSNPELVAAVSRAGGLGIVQPISLTFERPMLALMLGNPVDLARSVIILQSDTAALMGYTGAVMQRFLGSAVGTAAAALGLLAWIVLPMLVARRSFERRDF